MLSASSLVESLLVSFPLFIFLYSPLKKRCIFLFFSEFKYYKITQVIWEDKTNLANLGFSLNHTPFFKTRKKSQLSAYTGQEKVRNYTEGNFKKKKESKRRENKKLQEQGRKQRKRNEKNYIKQYNKTYLVTCIFILVGIAILHSKDVRTRKN